MCKNHQKLYCVKSKRRVYYGCNIDDTEKIGFRDSVFYQMQEEGMGDKVSELDRKACLKLYEEYLSINDRKNY